MNITITGHHVEVTPAIREYAESKLDKVIRHFEQVTSISLMISVEKLLQKAEITVRIPGKDIYVESSAPDLYASIDLLVDKLDRQLLKSKQKLQNRGHTAIKYQHLKEESE